MFIAALLKNLECNTHDPPKLATSMPRRDRHYEVEYQYSPTLISGIIAIIRSLGKTRDNCMRFYFELQLKVEAAQKTGVSEIRALVLTCRNVY